MGSQGSRRGREFSESHLWRQSELGSSSARNTAILSLECVWMGEWGGCRDVPKGASCSFFVVLLYISCGFPPPPRDLKPENILLNEDMHIQITDFGTAKVLSADSKQGACFFLSHSVNV